MRTLFLSLIASLMVAPANRADEPDNIRRNISITR
jgi:hypothetical protein